MKRFAGTLALAASLSALPGVPAWCEEAPKPASKLDSRMRVIAYDPNQVVHLATAAGTTLVIRFGGDETVVKVAVDDSLHLKSAPEGNFLFLKSATALPLQPVYVLTEGPEHRLRRYVFELAVNEPGPLANNAPDVYYSVQFTYPLDEAAARRAKELADAQQAAADARKEAAAAEARAAANELKLAHQQIEHEARDPASGNRNWKYIAQGDRSILPLEVYDNGFSTVFRFPGNVRVPGVFQINPDGKEATSNYSVKGTLVEVDSTARQWRLRDGGTVLCIWNLAYDPVGHNPGTGTTSPAVTRELKEAPQ